MMTTKSNALNPKIWLGLFAAIAIGMAPALANEKRLEEHKPEAQSFVHGRPNIASEAWLLGAGGRIYDNWWDALDRKKPDGTHPSYPAASAQTGPGTWRCKECHGWDYKGRDGGYRTGSHATGIVGIGGAAGRDVKDIVALLRQPVHGYSEAMINDEELARVAAFVSRGQHDTSRVIEARTGEVSGNLENGRGVYQTICAACHGFDGRLLNWGTADKPAYIGTEARKFPEEVLHKIRNSHPGAAMVSLRAMPLDAAVDLLKFVRTLPAE